MSGDGVRVATAFIELNVDDSSVTDTVKGALDNAGTYAKKSAKDMGDSISSGIKTGLDQVAKQSKSTFDSVAQNIRQSIDNAGTAIAAGKLKLGLDTIGNSARGVQGLIAGVSSSAQNVVSQIDALGSSMSKVFSGDTKGRVKGVADILGQLSKDAESFGTNLGPIPGALQNLSQGADTVQGLATQFKDINASLAKAPGLIRGIGTAMVALEAVRQLSPGQGEAFDRMIAELRGDKPLSFKDFANALVPLTNDRIPVIGSKNPIFSQLGQIGGAGEQWPTGGAGSMSHDGGSFLPGLMENLGRGGGGAMAGAPSSLTPPPGAGAEGWRPAVRAAIAQYGPRVGITNAKAWEDALIRQIGTESGGNPGADNPHDSNGAGGTQHVSGLLQFLPSTYAANNISGLPYMDPHGQIAAALAYTAARWGVNPDGSPRQIGRGQGFDEGGPVLEDMQAQVHAGEHVLNPADVAALGGQPGVQAFRDMLHSSGGNDVSAPQSGSTDEQQAQAADLIARTIGFLPAAGAEGGVAGTSSLARLFGLGNEVTAGLIDTGASAAETAINMGISAAVGGGMAAGTFGGGAAAAPAVSAAASAATSYGIQLAATEAKRVASYAWQLGAIWADAGVEQLFPLGAPRWIGYDYTQFLPQLNISQVGVTTAERAMAALAQGGGQRSDLGAMAADPGGPVNPTLLPGAQVPGAPVPAFGASQPQAPPSGVPGTGPAGGPAMSGPPAPAPPPPQPAQPPSPPGPLDFIPKDFGGVFDDGGIWPSDTWGLNTSGRPELVLSPQQMDSMALLMPAARSSGDTYYITAKNDDEIIRKLRSMNRLESRRYTGRPTGL
ncbi:hypothetical protein LAUMK4_05829 [Mycobacterium persicum]|uniref:Transglycosylase SLT domain-containing protein n=1 Tax=Mycobacterium persicum TaxID=1487726 RepID=A0ABY6RSG0_9MYCO|nr:hypothetical protein [Mycobacterium persicum]ORB93952.1 hypothetical protein B1T44_04760 [Mycobacterium persicum]VAZ77462.1 hypothetical protein LAUMK15_03834 [Mycobacterium persicum]VBA32931.1 hypothetical protein LAUMK4_05829 [Mycobacterium persicum]